MLRSTNAAPRLSSTANDPIDKDTTALVEITDAVIEAAIGLRFGSIEIVIH